MRGDALFDLSSDELLVSGLTLFVLDLYPAQQVIAQVWMARFQSFTVKALKQSYHKQKVREG